MKYIGYLLCLILASCSSKKDNDVNLNLIPVKSGQYWGYMNQEGKFIINPQFKYAFAFSEGLALIRSSDDKYGYINNEGKFIINPIYKSALAFREGMAAVVKENAQIEFIDKDGATKLTLPPEVESAFSFFDGRATIKINGYYGFIDKAGKIVIPCTFSSAYHFKNGLARVSIYDSSSNVNKFGFINDKGETKVNYQFQYVEDFNDGLALISNGKQYGYIDKDGKYIINPQFDHATSFEENYAVIKQGDLFGYINKDGKITINPQYKFADKFYDEIAAVKGTDGRFGFIDKEGKYIINPQFEHASRFYSGIAFLTMAGKQGLIDKTGKIIVNPQFDGVNTQIDSDSWINSDFFDSQAIISYIIGNITDNSVNGYSAATTFNQLKSKYPGFNEQNYTDFTDFTEAGNKYVQLKKIFTSFNGGLTTSTDNFITQQVYDAVAGGYTTQRVYAGSTEVANPNATLDGITLMYNLYDKAKIKKSEVIKALKNQLKSYQLSTTESEDNITYFTFANKNFTIFFNSEIGYDIYLQVTFNVTPKNQVSLPAVDTTAN